MVSTFWRQVFIFGMLTGQYANEEPNMLNPEANNQMALLVPSEVPT